MIRNFCPSPRYLGIKVRKLIITSTTVKPTKETRTRAKRIIDENQKNINKRNAARYKIQIRIKIKRSFHRRFLPRSHKFSGLSEILFIGQPGINTFFYFPEEKVGPGRGGKRSFGDAAVLSRSDPAEVITVCLGLIPVTRPSPRPTEADDMPTGRRCLSILSIALPTSSTFVLNVGRRRLTFDTRAASLVSGRASIRTKLGGPFDLLVPRRLSNFY